MRYALFPYELVSQGARVILYGMGFVGQQYVQQVMANRYCELLFAVDRHASSVKCSEIAVRPIEALLAAQGKYDAVVVALLDSTEANRVKSELVEQGVEAGKIICHSTTIQMAGDSEDFESKVMSSLDRLEKQNTELASSVPDAAKDVKHWLCSLAEREWAILCDLESYAYNDFATRYCPGYMDSSQVDKLRTLLSLLRVKRIATQHRLVRVGQWQDGGYVIVDNYPHGGDSYYMASA